MAIAAFLLLPLLVVATGSETRAALGFDAGSGPKPGGLNQVSPTACDLTIKVEGDGRVETAAGNKPPVVANQPLNQQRVRCGTLVTLTAVPDGGWRFDHWQGVAEAERMRPTIQVTVPAAVTAVFVPRSSYIEPVATPFYDRSGKLVSGIELLQPVAPALPVFETDAAAAAVAAPAINVWYGNTQNFGQIGTPQQWINILGNASDADGDLSSLRYSLNGGPAQSLSFGGDGSPPDGRRLWNLGDFNVDIDKDTLLAGDNLLVITAEDSGGRQASTGVTINYDPTTDWPIPYSINWSSVAAIQDAAQIVDGKWNLSSAGARPAETGYDRIIAIGEGNFAGAGWREFEVTVEVTVHGYSEAGFQGSQVAPAIGLVARWQGHTDTPVAGCQPKCGWLPVGAVGWYTWDETTRQPYYTMWAHHARDEMKPAPSVTTMALNQTYLWKMRVENVIDTRGTYYFKVWQKGTSEPAGWQASFDSSDRGWNYTMLESGSILLLAHHVDVTFGNVQIRSLDGGSDATATPTPLASPTATAAATATPTTQPGAGRVTQNLLTLYRFEENQGATVHDLSGAGAPLDLTISGNASWLVGGGLAVDGAMISSPGAAAKISGAVQASNALSLEAWVRPANVTQDGPARIAGISNGSTTRNITLGQGLWGSRPKDLYDVRLRSSTTSDNGQPSLTSATGTAQAALQHLVFTYDGSQRKLYINGNLATSDTPGGNLANWDGGYRLYLANEASADRPWSGELHLVAFYGRSLTAAEVTQNFLAGAHPVSGATSTPTPTTSPPTATSTPPPTATNTAVPTATNTPVPTPTFTPLPSATNTPLPTATNTPTATATGTLEPTSTSTSTPVAPTATNTPLPTATSTPVAPTPTFTPLPSATNTAVPTATNTAVPTATNTAAPTATNTPVPVGCAPVPGNVLDNPGFEAGTANWRLHTSGGVGSLEVSSPAYQCDLAARLTFDGSSGNMQFFQHGFPLEPNTDYILSFAAYSNSGHNLRVYLHRHSSPYTNYGINGETADLSTSWQTVTIPFTTGDTVTNPRLRFWFVGDAASGDSYWIDDIRLVPAGSGPTATATNTPLPVATNTPTPTATHTPVPTASSTPLPTATNTPVPTATRTPLPTATNTPGPTSTPTYTPVAPTATNTPLPTATSTATPTATSTATPTVTNTPVPTPTNTPVPSGCTPLAGSVLSNPGFEEGTIDWRLYTSGSVGSFGTDSPAFECELAARLAFSGSSSNMQFFQHGFTLEPDTDYVLSFAAYSNSGHDLRVYLHRHSSPYTNYGLSGVTADLTTAWRTYEIPFRTGSTVSDPRLRFWFVGDASAGDIYWIDDVRITRAGS